MTQPFHWNKNAYQMSLEVLNRYRDTDLLYVTQVYYVKWAFFLVESMHKRLFLGECCISKFP